jgi:hypothetical protein
MNYLMSPYRNPQRRERLLNLAEYRVKPAPSEVAEAHDSDECDSSESGDGAVTAGNCSAADQA